MRRFRDIVEDIKAPSPQSLWLDNGKLKFFGTKGWVSMVGEGDDDRQELEEKVDNLDKEVGSIQKDVAVLNSVDIGTEEALTFTLEDGSTVTKKIRVLSNTTTPAT